MKLLIRSLLFFLFFQTSFAIENLNRCNIVFKFEDLAKTMNSIEMKTVIHAAERSGTLKVLKAEEYSTAVRKETLLPTDILLLERIDTKLDLPFVSGIIISEALPPGKTHLDEMAEKLNIPFIHIPYIFRSFDLVGDSLNGSPLNLNTKRSEPIQNFEQKNLHETSFLKSVLPRKNEVENIRLVKPEEAIHEPIGVVGEKFKWMSALKISLGSENLPDFVGITSGLYQYFLDQKLPRSSQSLRDFINIKLMSLESENDIQVKLETLKSIRGTMKIVARSPLSQIDTGFSEVYSQLKSYYGEKLISNTRFSIRSNNSIEDLIGAGLYHSNHSKINNLANFKDSVLKVWLSSYSPRAYFTRKYFGVIETNHNMPIMLHPFLGKQHSHSVMEFRPYEVEEYIASGQIILGEKSRATNPSTKDKVIAYEIVNDGYDSLPVVELKNNIFSNQELYKPISNAHQKMYQAIQKLKLLDSALSDIWSFEWMLQNTQNGEEKLVILQVKNKLYLDQVHSILKGELYRDSFKVTTGENLSHSEKPAWINRQLDKAGLVSLPNFLMRLKEESKLNGHILNSARFIMLEIEGNTHFIISRVEDRFIHESMWRISKQQLNGINISLKNTGLIDMKVFNGALKLTISKPNQHRFGSAIWFKNLFLKHRIIKEVKQIYNDTHQSKIETRF